jgi:hypothetical protein
MEAAAMHEMAIHLQEVETDREELRDRIAELHDLKPALRRATLSQLELETKLSAARGTMAVQAQTIETLKRRFRAAVVRQSVQENLHVRLLEEAVSTARRDEAQAVRREQSASRAEALESLRSEHAVALVELEDRYRAREAASTAREDSCRMLLAEAKLELAEANSVAEEQAIQFQRQHLAVEDQMTFTMLQLTTAKMELADIAAARSKKSSKR